MLLNVTRMESFCARFACINVDATSFSTRAHLVSSTRQFLVKPEKSAPLAPTSKSASAITNERRANSHMISTLPLFVLCAVITTVPICNMLLGIMVDKTAFSVVFTFFFLSVLKEYLKS